MNTVSPIAQYQSHQKDNTASAHDQRTASVPFSYTIRDEMAGGQTLPKGERLLPPENDDGRSAAREGRRVRMMDVDDVEEIPTSTCKESKSVPLTAKNLSGISQNDKKKRMQSTIKGGPKSWEATFDGTDLGDIYDEVKEALCREAEKDLRVELGEFLFVLYATGQSISDWFEIEHESLLTQTECVVSFLTHLAQGSELLETLCTKVDIPGIKEKLGLDLEEVCALESKQLELQTAMRKNGTSTGLAGPLLSYFTLCSSPDLALDNLDYNAASVLAQIDKRLTEIPDMLKQLYSSIADEFFPKVGNPGSEVDVTPLKLVQSCSSSPTTTCPQWAKLMAQMISAIQESCSVALTLLEAFQGEDDLEALEKKVPLEALEQALGDADLDANLYAQQGNVKADLASVMNSHLTAVRRAVFEHAIRPLLIRWTNMMVEGNDIVRGFMLDNFWLVNSVFVYAPAKQFIAELRGMLVQKQIVPMRLCLEAHRTKMDDDEDNDDKAQVEQEETDLDSSDDDENNNLSDIPEEDDVDVFGVSTKSQNKKTKKHKKHETSDNALLAESAAKHIKMGNVVGGRVVNKNLMPMPFVWKKFGSTKMSELEDDMDVDGRAAQILDNMTNRNWIDDLDEDELGHSLDFLGAEDDDEVTSDVGSV
ncbi:unnamed protein product [Amoebophrya sp. A25]|nr:unnamed protein product [Amoebophrya sp. A25]|eukprot:GSA25T00006057001.1